VVPQQQLSLLSAVKSVSTLISERTHWSAEAETTAQDEDVKRVGGLLELVGLQAGDDGKCRAGYTYWKMEAVQLNLSVNLQYIAQTTTDHTP